jgi:hypothetical protein
MKLTVLTLCILTLHFDTFDVPHYNHNRLIGKPTSTLAKSFSHLMQTIAIEDPLAWKKLKPNETHCPMTDGELDWMGWLRHVGVMERCWSIRTLCWFTIKVGGHHGGPHACGDDDRFPRSVDSAHLHNGCVFYFTSFVLFNRTYQGRPQIR